jgi:hypothetical protein
MEPKSQEKIDKEATPPNGSDKYQIGLEMRPNSQLRDYEKQAHLRECPDTARERFTNISFLPRSFSVDRESRYHGPTSAMFDEKSPGRRTQRRGTTEPRTSEEWVKSRLMAEATKQRTFEFPQCSQSFRIMTIWQSHRWNPRHDAD